MDKDASATALDGVMTDSEEDETLSAMLLEAIRESRGQPMVPWETLRE
jgi:hypothetical protein